MLNLKKVNWSIMREAAGFFTTNTVMFFALSGAIALFRLLGIKHFILMVVFVNASVLFIVCACLLAVRGLKAVYYFWRGRGGK